MEVHQLIKYFIENHFYLTQYASYIIVEKRESTSVQDLNRSNSIVDLHFLDDHAFDHMFVKYVLGNNNKYQYAAIETYEEYGLSGNFEPSISMVTINHHFFFRSYLIPRKIFELNVRITDMVYLPKRDQGSIEQGEIDGGPLDWSKDEVRQIIAKNLLMARVRMQAPDASVDQLTEMIMPSGLSRLHLRNF